MDMKIIISTATNEFKQKLTDFCKNHATRELTPELSQEFMKVTKDALATLGMTAVKEFIESFDCRKDHISQDGKFYRLKFKGERRFLTLFGEIKINRNIYQRDIGGECLTPLDSYWGMKGEYAAIDVRESILYSSSQNTPEDTAKLFQKVALFTPSATTIKRVVKKEGDFIEEHREEIKSRILELETLPENTDVVVASMDGANVLLNEQGKKKGRPRERPTNKNVSESSSCYKNAMVGSISFYEKYDDERPERLSSRYLSRMPEDKALTFKNEFEKEVRSVIENPEIKAVDKIVLCDGARGIWKYIEGSKIFNGFELLVDYYHTMEYVSKAAEAIFGKNNDLGTYWYKKWKKQLLEDNTAPQALIRSIKYYRDTYKLAKYQREALKSSLTFLRNNKKKMNYADFINRGLPIGSGPVEAACKTLVKQRMCRSGMRWSRNGGENILHLRTLVKSNRWETYWNWYKEFKNAA
jgi:effector-binding domain-containing protein